MAITIGLFIIGYLLVECFVLGGGTDYPKPKKEDNLIYPDAVIRGNEVIKLPKEFINRR